MSDKIKLLGLSRKFWDELRILFIFIVIAFTVKTTLIEIYIVLVVVLLEKAHHHILKIILLLFMVQVLMTIFQNQNFH